MRSGMGNLMLTHMNKIYFLEMGVIFILYLYVNSSPYLFVCGDDQIIYYPVADDVTGESGDA